MPSRYRAQDASEADDARRPEYLNQVETAGWHDMPAAYLTAPEPASHKKSGDRISSVSGKSSSYGGKPNRPAYTQAQAQRQDGQPVPKRQVHYSGRATLRSTEPDRVLDSAVAVVQAAGGYLEQRSSGFVALRVPAGDFDSLFVRLMRLAEVVEYSQEAEDITEAVQDTEQRLRAVEATLERLEALVQKAKTEAQKLRLLRELKRLREEREVLEARRRELAQSARFASIRLWVRQHAPVAGNSGSRTEIADFKWIHTLNPFQDRRFRRFGTTYFRTPAGMVRSKFWYPRRSTSSQGSEFWGSDMEVDILGDSRFWMEAIRTRLKDGYKVTMTLQAGAFHFCSFQSYGPKPYYYMVGVRARGDVLDLAEIYFPDEAEQVKLLPAILAEVERISR